MDSRWVIRVLISLVGLPSYEPIALNTLDQHTLPSKALALRHGLLSLWNTAEEKDHRREVGRGISIVCSVRIDRSTSF